MDIHGPEGPIRSVKHFFLHLLTITIGILIALSLEGTVEWVHHRSLVAEARMNLASEIRNNKVNLDKALAGSAGLTAELGTALQIAADRLANKKVTVDSVGYDYRLAELTAGSRTTAETTGALSFMPYMDVKRYADLYDLQQEFLHVQDHMLESVVAAMSVGDPTALNVNEIETWKHDLQTAAAYLIAETQLGKELTKKYAEAAAW